VSGFILAVDDKKRLKEVIEEALPGYDVKVVQVADAASAKRTLIQAVPCVIICFVSLGEDSQAGLRLCQDLRAHAELSKVPLMLASEELSPELLQASSESGASGLLAWPTSVEMLERRISAILPPDLRPKQGEKEKLRETDKKQAVATKPAPQQQPSLSSKTDEDEQQKLTLAQQLLAKVLHGLKTSDLLSVADIEDVPRIVFEMTRSVCGISSESSIANKASKEGKTETEIDLDSVFGLKNRS
jgi:DNA-binding response OmpR family regulator